MKPAAVVVVEVPMVAMMMVLSLYSGRALATSHEGSLAKLWL